MSQKLRRSRVAKVSRDRHALYERSVQSPDSDVKFFDRVYRERFRRAPLTLKEDFCGTANLSCAWVRSHPEREALGVDLDQPTLDYGRKKHLAPLGARAEAVTLRRANVLDVRDPKVDVVAALNFSYFVFKDRAVLTRYFANAKRSLGRQGLFLADIFGGWESQALTTETKQLDGFDYLWEQAAFNPVTAETLFHIHFRFKGGEMMRRAFSYDWRFWTIPEVVECLREAGFARTQVYWEGTELKTGEGNGVFKPTTRPPTCPGWIAYILAW